MRIRSRSNRRSPERKCQPQILLFRSATSGSLRNTQGGKLKFYLAQQDKEPGGPSQRWTSPSEIEAEPGTNLSATGCHAPTRRRYQIRFTTWFHRIYNPSGPASLNPSLDTQEFTVTPSSRPIPISELSINQLHGRPSFRCH